MDALDILRARVQVSRTQREHLLMTENALAQLAAVIASRRSEASDKSYTRQLLDGGAERCAKKLGEEAVETVIAGVSQSDEALRKEAADLIYHLLVLLEVRGVPLSDVLGELAKRSQISGLAEKASRTQQ